MEQILGILRYACSLYFGIATSFCFAGIGMEKKRKILVPLFFIFEITLQLISWRLTGFEVASQLYPFLVHFPLMLLLALGFRCSLSVSAVTVFSAYLCCLVPRWFSLIGAVAFQSRIGEHLCSLAASFILYYLLKRFVAKPVENLVRQSTRACLLFGAVPFFCYIFDYVTTIYTDLLYSGAKIVMEFMPSLIALFYFMFAVLYYSESKHREEAQREHDSVSMRLREAKLELSGLRTMQEQAILYRHDMRHHLSLIGSFAAEGNVEKIKDYISRAATDIDAVTPTHYCENETVNLILSSFDKAAKRQDVSLCVDVKLPNDPGISETELCALISNALENAVMAASQVEDKKSRRVYVRILINNNRLLLATENAYMGTIRMDGGLPVSKNTENGHGLGVKSMINIVERFDGIYSIETTGGVFALHLMIPLKINE